jgi:hypothetical protein
MVARERNLPGPDQKPARPIDTHLGVFLVTYHSKDPYREDALVRSAHFAESSRVRRALNISYYSMSRLMRGIKTEGMLIEPVMVLDPENGLKIPYYDFNRREAIASIAWAMGGVPVVRYDSDKDVYWKEVGSVAKAAWGENPIAELIHGDKIDAPVKVESTKGKPLTLEQEQLEQLEGWNVNHLYTFYAKYAREVDPNPELPLPHLDPNTVTAVRAVMYANAVVSQKTAEYDPDFKELSTRQFVSAASILLHAMQHNVFGNLREVYERAHAGDMRQRSVGKAQEK